MSYEGEPRVGRPRGPSEKTADLQRGCLFMSRNGMTAEAIAEFKGISPSYVRDLIRAAEAAAELSSQPSRQPPQTAPATYQTPKPYSPDALLRRAWTLTENHPPARVVPDATKMFWFRVIRTIGATLDGVLVRFGESSGYLDRADFCAIHNATDADLALLFRRGLLIEVKDGAGGIALPKGLGLRQQERTYPKALPAFLGALLSTSRNGDQSHFEGQTGPGYGFDDTHDDLAGGPEFGPEYSRRSDGNIIQNDGKTDGKTSPNDGTIDGDIPATALVRATAAATKSPLDSSALSSSGSAFLPPGASERADGENDGNITPNDGNIPVNDGIIESKRNSDDELAVIALGQDLARLAKVPTALNSAEVAEVRRWREAGLTREMMVAVITRLLQRSKRPTKMNTLGYFTGSMDDEIARIRKVAGAPGPVPIEQAPPMSDDDRRVRDLIQESADAWIKDRSCPFPPSFITFKAAVAKGSDRLALRWVETFSAWNNAGRPSAYKPPDFTNLARTPSAFEAALDVAEEGLTEPVPAASDGDDRH